MEYFSMNPMLQAYINFSARRRSVAAPLRYRSGCLRRSVTVGILHRRFFPGGGWAADTIKVAAIETGYGAWDMGRSQKLPT